MKEIFAYMVLFTKDMVGFSQTAMQRARGAYFANRHDTFWKELNFNFPEHQNFLKSIKNSTRKLKKSEIFLKILEFFKKSEILIFNTIFNMNVSNIFSKISDFLKNFKNFKNISDFFDFLIGFFMDFKFF